MSVVICTSHRPVNSQLFEVNLIPLDRRLVMLRISTLYGRRRKIPCGLTLDQAGPDRS